jgi:hypothetical protein
MQKMARQGWHQGKDGKGKDGIKVRQGRKDARQGMPSRQDGMPSSASAIAIIGMPSSARHAIGKARDARTQGIGMPSSASSASACHHRQLPSAIAIGIGMPSASASAAAGRQDAAQWRSIVIQVFQECLDAQLCKFLSEFENLH